MLKQLLFAYAERFLDNFCLKNPHFQDYVNHRFNEEEYILVNRKFTKNTFCSHEGIYYEISDQLHLLDEIDDEYDFSDVRSTDVVLDIGANVGTVTMPLTKRAKHVYTVEPLYSDVLRRNVAKNKLNNVTILDTGIGTGFQTLKYRSRSKNVELTSFNDIIKRCGQIDFLKCDCEGCEWNIEPDDLRGIRRIEIEVHKFNGMPSHRKFEEMLKNAGFDFTTDIRTAQAVNIHAEAR